MTNNDLNTLAIQLYWETQIAGDIVIDEKGRVKPYKNGDKGFLIRQGEDNRKIYGRLHAFIAKQEDGVSIPSSLHKYSELMRG